MFANLTTLNTANFDVGTAPECIPCMFSELYKHVGMHTFCAKIFVFFTTFRLRNRDITHVERIPYMFAEINVFSTLNAANIDIASQPECIACMISATYPCINKY